jgi:hypothetical protein
MLFKFEKFWKTTALIIGTWIFYGIWGFEFAVVTLLAAIFASNLKNTTKFI